MTRLSRLSLLLCTLLLASCAAAPSPARTASAGTGTPAAPANPKETPAPEPSATAPGTDLPIRRGVNIGNCLEAPSEGAWGLKVRREWFSVIRQAGFDHVRLPVRWSAYAAEEPPYAIDEAFLKRVDEVIGWALDAGLAVILNTHHYAEYCEDPAGQRQRLFGIWENLAEHYEGLPDTVLFEPFNEPNGKADEVFFRDAAELVRIIRRANPGRWIVIDGVHWANVPQITRMTLPEDGKLVASVHMYEPFRFTHQGASWVEGSAQWTGTMWDGTQADRRFVTDLLDIAENAGRELGVPVYVGEFGAYAMADYASRVRWTSFVARECEQRGMAWAYWEFYSGFGIYDSGRKKYDPKLLEALIPPVP